MQGFERLVKAFAEACDAARVEYAFMGGIAVNAWGEARATRDADVLLSIVPEQVERLVEELRRRDLEVQAQDILAAFTDRAHVSVFDARSIFHADVKLARQPAEKAQVESAARVELDAAVIRVTRPEETIAFKVLYGSALDLQDAESILIRQWPRLDLERLMGVAQRLDVADEVTRLVAKVRATAPED